MTTISVDNILSSKCWMFSSVVDDVITVGGFGNAFTYPVVRLEFQPPALYNSHEPNRRLIMYILYPTNVNKFLFYFFLFLPRLSIPPTYKNEIDMIILGVVPKPLPLRLVESWPSNYRRKLNRKEFVSFLGVLY